jgi:hypothetical protein
MGEQATSGTDSGKLYRRLILGACVIAALINLLLAQGCAQVERRELADTCQIADHPHAGPAPEHGRITLAWAFNQGFPHPDRRWGETTCDAAACVIRLEGPPPRFDDICALARLGHEAREAMEHAP